jgi:DNA-dependent metalloprotease WSS1
MQFQKQLEGLWARGYTGEGFWATGRTLLSGSYTHDKPLSQEYMPVHICSGEYRESSTTKKPKAPPKPKPTYKEREQRRIIKKFGALEGKTVGGDMNKRKELEGGKVVKSKPSVAASQRSRALRAAAALKRFEPENLLGLKPEPKSSQGFKKEAIGVKQDPIVID